MKSKYRLVVDALFNLHKESYEAGRENSQTPYEKMDSDSDKFDRSCDLVYKLAEKINRGEL